MGDINFQTSVTNKAWLINSRYQSEMAWKEETIETSRFGTKVMSSSETGKADRNYKCKYFNSLESENIQNMKKYFSRKSAETQNGVCGIYTTSHFLFSTACIPLPPPLTGEKLHLDSPPCSSQTKVTDLT